GILDLFVSQGFGLAIVQRKEVDPTHLDTAFWTQVLTAGLLATLTILMSTSVARLAGNMELSAVLRWLSLSLIVSAFSRVQVALLTRDLMFRPLAIRTLIGDFSGGFVGVIMAWNGYGVWSLVGQQLSSSIVGVLALWTASSWRPGLQLSWCCFIDLSSFGLNITGDGLLLLCSRRSDELLIGYLLGPGTLGIYAVGK